ncbi:MAG TPA: hypothetical protein VD788_00755 [Candidatus Polarisedimenticolaceae bacterium]|nr:hypothetical protein [Candidatus Polarisedimenticolaceae bacterium]
MHARRPLVPLVCLLLLSAPVLAKKDKDKPEGEGPFKTSTFAGLAFRGIGPAVTSGRISDIAVDPTDPARYFLAVASGGVWRTVNSGTTWEPVFDDQGSYSIGCVTIDPHDPLTVWVGTGENNSQRSVSYGDGVYRSTDGGTRWTRMGLELSEHIAKIVVDPRTSDTVWVAAQGPLWAPGGERGLYKSTDGGASWQLSLEIGENTGVTDVVLDPRNPDVVYAAAYQRRRHVWTLIDGGPESAIFKSTDGGASWTKLTNGLPEADLGRIGLAVSPADPDVVYAIVEAERDEGGFFRSTDAGGNWTKRSEYVSDSPQYYQEIVADPRDPDRVYSLDTWMMVSEDGGENFRRVGNRSKHVDDHALWIDPHNTDHLRAGCDGGLYESWDRGANWAFTANLPLTQFYRVTPDNDWPFYNVYGGTQDNFTLGGPARTISLNGIANGDWIVTLGGDGFEPQIDPDNPDIVYSQYQYGGLSRFDRRSGERIDIQPQVGPDEDPLRWNWDSALIISPHSSTRLYFAAQRVFRSDDRGDHWRPISGDLTRQLARDSLEVMGRVQKADAVAKGASTSPYGNIVALSESARLEGLIYAGTDDGLVQLLEPETGEWRAASGIDGVPELSYVSDLQTSLHRTDTVFAALDNHKSGDFAPYLFRSDDRGKSWKSIVGDLPARGTVYTVVEDDVRPELLFAGTEFGVYFTIDGGRRWIRLKGGIPVIAVRDLEIQRRETDLVVGTFGRGIYILDDYSPLRRIDAGLLERPAALFAPRESWMFMPSLPLGLPAKSFQGDDYYAAPNPAFGAVLTYYLKDGLETRAERRRRTEKETEQQGRPYDYPEDEELRAEMLEHDPAVLLTIRDAEGRVVRRLDGPVTAGIHRIAWDLRFPPSTPVRLDAGDPDPFDPPPVGPMVLPGRYTVELATVVDGVVDTLGAPETIVATPLGLATLAAGDRAGLLEFQRRTADLQRAVLGAVRVVDETERRIDHLRRAIHDTPGADPDLAVELRAIENRLAALTIGLSGDPLIRRYNNPAPRSVVDRVERIVSSQWTSTAPPTGTNLDAYRIAGEGFAPLLEELRAIVEGDLPRIERRLDQVGAPWTPGRVPRWSMDDARP